MQHKLEDHAARQAACYELIVVANVNNLMNNNLFRDDSRYITTLS